MSRRNTYVFGAVAVLLGTVLIIVAVTTLSGDADGGGNGAGESATAPAGETTPSQAPPVGGRPEGERAEGRKVTEHLARRRKVRAPGFALDVVEKGERPAQAREPLARAGGDGSLTLERLRGTPVVLHMWSSACPPCRADARLVQNTWERWGRRGVVFVGLSVDEPAAATRRFARQYELSYPIVSDEGGTVARAFGATSLPETFFISSSGDIVGHVAGSPSVRHMELGTGAARTGRTFGSEQGGSRVPLG